MLTDVIFNFESLFHGTLSSSYIHLTVLRLRHAREILPLVKREIKGLNNAYHALNLKKLGRGIRIPNPKPKLLICM